MGSIVCKAERELEDDPLTGYIAMLAVDTTFRKHGIGEGLSCSFFSPWMCSVVAVLKGFIPCRPPSARKKRHGSGVKRSAGA